MIKEVSATLTIATFLLSFCINMVFAAGNDHVENQYFSINIPNTWTYIEYSGTPESAKTGFGPGNQIWLTPNEFSDLLLINNVVDITEKLPDGGAFATFFQDSFFRIKNVPLSHM